MLVDRSVPGVATITLNRPERLNALTVAMADQLGAALVEVDADPQIGCVLLTGAGRGFCAGGDMGLVSDGGGSAGSGELDAVAAEAARTAKMHREIPLRIHHLSKPTVAFVNGAAAGAGLSLACACDIRVASSAAKFTTAFIRIGRSGDFGGTFFLPRLVGHARARELYFTSEVLDAQTALDIGLVEHVYPPSEAQEQAMALASRIAEGPPATLAKMKQMFRAAEGADLETLLDLEATTMALTGQSGEAQRLLAEFLSSRG